MVNDEFRQRSSRNPSLKRWSPFVGVPNLRGEKLTKQMLYTWISIPAKSRMLECVYDGNRMPVNAHSCSKCKDFTGLVPYIPSWSDWNVDIAIS